MLGLPGEEPAPLNASEWAGDAPVGAGESSYAQSVGRATGDEGSAQAVAPVGPAELQSRIEQLTRDAAWPWLHDRRPVAEADESGKLVYWHPSDCGCGEHPRDGQPLSP